MGYLGGQFPFKENPKLSKKVHGIFHTSQKRIEFLNDLSQVNWNALIARGGNDIDKVFSIFYNKLNGVVNKNAPS